MARDLFANQPVQERTGPRDLLSAPSQPSPENQSDRVRSGWDAAILGALDTGTLGFLDEAASGIDYLIDRLPGGQGRNYSEILAANRGEQQQAQDDYGKSYLAGQVGGAVGLPLGMARGGLTLMRGGVPLAQQVGRGAIEGALYGAAAGAGTSEGNRFSDAVSGGVTGGALGGIAPAVVAGGAKVAQSAMDGIRTHWGPAAQQAANRIAVSLRNSGLDDAAIAQRLNELGPEGVLVDVMGARGQSLARSAANVSPDARSTLEGFSQARMSQQPQRVVSAVEDAAGLPQGNRLTVEGLKDAANARAMPEINAAYRQARELGFDLPLEDFQEIIGSPMGRTAFADASKAVQNRMAAGGDDAASNLGLLDAMKRRFDSMASQAARAGDNDTAAQASALSRRLRDQMDAALDSPAYSRARELRQAQYRVDDAFDTGAELAGSRIALDGPTRARALVEANPETADSLAKGYAAELAERLLNRRGTADSLNSLYTPMQQEAMSAALQGGAGRVNQQLANERVFGETHRALTGNSSTARQLAEMGAFGGVGAGLGWIAGGDPASMGMGAIAGALARRGGGALARSVMSGREANVAPEIAKLLIQRGVPITEEGVRTALSSTQGAQEIARMLVGASGQYGGR